MDWQTTLVSHMGVGAGGFAVAAAVYKGASALENELRPQAVKEIGRILTNATFPTDNFSINRIVYEAFNSTFGDRHWSWKCVGRSLLASWIFVILFVALSSATDHAPLLGQNLDKVDFFGFLEAFGVLFFLLFLPDYISLYKTRYILRASTRLTNPWLSSLPLIADILVTSIFYPLAVGTAAIILVRLFRPDLQYRSYSDMISDEFQTLRNLFESTHYSNIIVLRAFVLSNYMTALWSTIVFISIFTLKSASYSNVILRAMRWAFDLEKHPVRALGLVAGATTWMVLLLASVL